MRAQTPASSSHASSLTSGTRHRGCRLRAAGNQVEWPWLGLGQVKVVAALIAALCAAMPVTGQTRVPTAGSSPSRFELAAGMTVGGSVDLGSREANLTPNLNGATFVLFDSSARFRSPMGGEARLGYRVVPWLVASLSGALLVGDVQVSVGHDAEGASAMSFAGERLRQTQIEGRVDVLVTRLRFWKARALPYVAVSAGTLWHWHEGNVLVETGQVFQLGGGVRVSLAHRPASRLLRVGVFGELRIAHVRDGFHWGHDARTSPIVHVGVYTGWGR